MRDTLAIDRFWDTSAFISTDSGLETWQRIADKVNNKMWLLEKEHHKLGSSRPNDYKASLRCLRWSQSGAFMICSCSCACTH